MLSILRQHPGSKFHHRLAVVSGLIVVCASCAAPRRRPLDDAQMAATVENRARSVAELECALALADLGPLSVPRPHGSMTDQMGLADPMFLSAAGYLYDPAVRQARRRLEARRALARGAGAVPSIDGSVDSVGDRFDYETEAMATIDLLALLGLGPAAAAKELARAEVCDALGELENAVWASRFRVERARVRLGGALARGTALEQLGQEAARDDDRIETLRQAGRGSPAEIAWARASRDRIAERRARAGIEAARAREELAVATGLLPDHPALAQEAASSSGGVLPPDTLSRAFPRGSTEPGVLLRRVPTLRALKLKYAVAEARVRTAAAATWPGVAVGPKIQVVPDAFLAGGILDLSVPLPCATLPAMRAAMIERTAAREAVEDELVRVVARNHSLNEQMSRLTGEVEARTRERLVAADEMWKAARARFLADESALAGWVLGLEMRVDAELSSIETREEEEILALDILEASPPDSESAVLEWTRSAPRLPETRPE